MAVDRYADMCVDMRAQAMQVCAVGRRDVVAMTDGAASGTEESGQQSCEANEQFGLLVGGK